MSSTNKTEHYDLPQWVGSDKPTFLGDFNSAFLSIDKALYQAKADADNAVDVANQANTASATAEPRISRLESQMSNNNATLTTLQNTINTNKIKLESKSFQPVNTASATAEPRISRLESQMSNNNATLTTLQNTINTNKIKLESKSFQPVTSRSDVTFQYDTNLGQYPLKIDKVTIPNVCNICHIHGYITMNVPENTNALWEMVDSISFPSASEFIGTNFGTGSKRSIYGAGFTDCNFKKVGESSGSQSTTFPVSFSAGDTSKQLKMFMYQESGFVIGNTVDIMIDKTIISR